MLSTAAQFSTSSRTSSTTNTIKLSSTANFQKQVVEDNNQQHTDGIDIDVSTNFDNKQYHRSITNNGDTNSNNDDEDAASVHSTTSHKSDFSFNAIAAKAMEHLDMEKLCSELFTQEILNQEMLEEAVAASSAVAGVNASSGTTQGQDDAQLDVSHHTGELMQSLSSSPPPPPPAEEVMGIKYPGNVTDCASSTDGSDASTTVPKTINVPSSKKLAPTAVPLKGGANNSLLQFSQQVTKKQRSNSGSANTTSPIFDYNGAALSSIISNSNLLTTNNNIPKTSSNELPVCEDDVICLKCNYPGADVRVRCTSMGSGGGKGGCAFHARCLDLNPLVCQPVTPTTSSGNLFSISDEGGNNFVNKCPCCHSPAMGLEIIPLSFIEMDRVQQVTKAAFSAGAKRPHSDLLGVIPTSIPSHAGAQPRRTVQCYDPANPRTGRWSQEEILFRDTLIQFFLQGNLPLSNGLKLNDFLPVMLKSKQSRLAKKMKNAKLSTKFFYTKDGCVSNTELAKNLSRLEKDFINSIPDLVERSEVSFHMRREWREHFANRCHSLNIVFDGEEFIESVDDMERRLAFETERHRLAKRRFMMGKAMEKDVGDGEARLEKGVFVNAKNDGKEEFELAVEKSVSNSSRPLPRPRCNSVQSSKGDQNHSCNDPNFKTAAPFLAGIASYIERNSVPFEHVDVWVPSYCQDSSTQGSGSSLDEKDNFRLCFGGSVTTGVSIEISNSTTPSKSTSSPMSSEDKTNFSIFGDYSSKFSFSSGCGLPGRVFKSGNPAWEQFVSKAPTALFERSGGACQFGVKTALAMPVDSPNVGRVVLIMYSKYDRKKDNALVQRMACDLKLLCPSPRWKLVVDMDTPSGKGVASSLQAPPRAVNTSTVGEFVDRRSSPMLSALPIALTRGTSTGSGLSNSAATSAEDTDKERQIKSLIVLLAANIPQDMESPLGKQLKGIMSLRLILLRGNRRTPEEEQLVDTVLVLYQSYISAGRSDVDICVMVARDFTFHLGHNKFLAAQFACPPPGGNGVVSPQLRAQATPPMYSMNAAQLAPQQPLMNPAMSYPQLAPHQFMTMGAAMGAPNSMNFHPRSHSMSDIYRQNMAGGLGSPRSSTSN